MTDAKTRAENHISKVGYLVLVMAMMSLSIVLWTSYQDRQETQCQKDVNQAFFDITKQRAQIADADRDAIRALVGGVKTAQTREEYLEVFDTYDKANKMLDKQRDELQYPTTEDICS